MDPLRKAPRAPTTRVYMKDEDTFIDYAQSVIKKRPHKAIKIIFDFLVLVWTKSSGFFRPVLHRLIEKIAKSPSVDNLYNGIEFVEKYREALLPGRSKTILKDMLYDMLHGLEDGKPVNLGEITADLKYTRKSRKSKHRKTRRSHH